MKHLTPKELADRLNVSINTISIWRAKGKGPKFIKIERTVRYRIEDVEAFEDKKLN